MIEVEKALKIPSIIVGPIRGKRGDRGVAKRFRVMPTSLEAWAIAHQVGFEERDVPEPVEEARLIRVPGVGGWRASLSLPSKGRPSSG